MTQQTINVGIQANDRQGDPLRIAFQKINSNFTELYTLSSDLPYSLPTASATTLGGVKVDGTSIVVNGEGVISSTAVGGVTSYAELDNLPDLTIYATTTNLATVATSGSYNDLSDKPTIPVLTGYATESWVQSQGYSTTAGFSGDYNDLTNKPYEITNTDGVNTWNISVATTGVISMNTARGGIEFGAMPEVGGPAHLHIMRPAGQNSSTDLYFGDDYNYVKMPGLYGSDPNGQQGVEIGSSLNEGTVNIWKFGTDGILTLPSGNTIIGNTLGSDAIISSPGTTFGVVSQGSGAGVLQWIDSISEPTTNAGIAVNSPYAATTGSVQIYTGAVGIPPQNAWTFDPTGHLTLPVGGDIKDSTGTSVLGGDGIALTDLSVGESGVPNSYGDFSYDNATGVFTFTPPDLTGYQLASSAFSGDYNNLTNKPTFRQTVSAGSGPGGNNQADSLILAGINPVTDIPSTWGGDLILQGGVGGSNGDLYGEIRIKSGTIGSNYEWHFTSDKKIKLPAGGDIVDSTGASVLGGSSFSGSYNDLTDKPTIPLSASGFVNADVDVTLGNLRARIPTSGNRSLQLSTVSGTYSVYGSGVYSYNGVGGQTITDDARRLITTTPTYIQSGYTFLTAGATDTWTLMDPQNNIAWRITMIIGSGYINNFISIERLL